MAALHLLLSAANYNQVLLADLGESRSGGGLVATSDTAAVVTSCSASRAPKTGACGCIFSSGKGIEATQKSSRAGLPALPRALLPAFLGFLQGPSSGCSIPSFSFLANITCHIAQHCLKQSSTLSRCDNANHRRNAQSAALCSAASGRHIISSHWCCRQDSKKPK